MKALRTTVMALGFAAAGYFGNVTEANAQTKPKASDYVTYESTQPQKPTLQQPSKTQNDTVDIASLDPYHMEENEVYNIKSLRIKYDRAAGKIIAMQVDAWKNLETNEPNNGITNISMSFGTVGADDGNKNAIGNHKNNTALFMDEFRFANDANYTPQARVKFRLQESGFSNKRDPVAFIGTSIENKSYPDVMKAAQLIKTMTFITEKDAIVELEVLNDGASPNNTNLQNNANRIMDDLAVYGRLVDPTTFRALETTSVDKDRPFNPSKRFTNKISLAVPNRFGN